MRMTSEEEEEEDDDDDDDDDDYDDDDDLRSDCWTSGRFPNAEKPNLCLA
jgi:hypothetical protein